VHATGVGSGLGGDVKKYAEPLSSKNLAVCFENIPDA
jgi:hypothetical protein